MTGQPMSSEADRAGERETATTRHWLEQQLGGGETSVCPVEQLLPGHSPRREGVLEEHVRLLLEGAAPLPPIIVHRPTMRVIDGMHRLRAAVVRGESEIEVRWFDGDERDVFALAVHTNVTHGLPLSHADRRAAARRIIASHPHWSDRMIASIVNLAPTTVRTVRRQAAAERAASDVRVGLDGRTRPASTATRRLRASELLRENPSLSMRELAKITGLAPSTVLDVRNRLRAGLDPVPVRRGRGEAAGDSAAEETAEENADEVDAGIVAPPIDHAKVLRNLQKDPSLRYTVAGRTVLRWLELLPIDPDKRTTVIDLLPPHCLDLVAALAGRQAETWHSFAEELGKRTVRVAREDSG
jgi:hypothetical protein